ncbi:MAG: FG-GAP repeat protein [Ignavibacteria bacterium]|nr:FG-GAP repeat protein [Ignavibacteria bacterium]
MGYSVSAAGDVNGDSYDDVTIGAYGYSGIYRKSFTFFGRS